MADEPQISILDARLAEIDRRLRTIQTGLADDVGNVGGVPDASGARDASAQSEVGSGLPPKISVPEPAPPEDDATAQDDVFDEDPALVIAELRGLISDQARLLDAMGELLASGERLLARAQGPAPAAAVPAPAAPAPAPAPVSASASAAAAPEPVTVTAGPFASLEAVRDFERALATLPNVASVDVRGYEGEDRAMVDVHLSRPNP